MTAQKLKGSSRMKKPINTRISLAILSLTSAVAQAGSFSLYTESNGYAVGNFAAGIAAEAFDASTAWYNPAGLALIHEQQMIVGGVGVLPSTTLSGYSQFNTIQAPLYVQSFNHIQGAENGGVPSFYYVRPFNQNITYGVSVTAPFGLSTNWSEEGPLRYAATYSQLITVDASPEIGARINDHLALGAGLDLEYAQVTFNSILGVPGIADQILGQAAALDSTSDNSGDSFGVGFHVGAMMMFQQNHTRFGLNYQSRVAQQFKGTSTLTGPLANPQTLEINSVFTTDNLVSNDIQFPEIITFYGYHDLNDKVAVLGSVVYTGWSVFKSIQLNNIAGGTFDDGAVPIDFTSTEDYRNAWRAALGLNYKINNRFMLRTGGGFDETPTINAQRTVRMPDANRWAISAGAHYQVLSRWSLDVGYSYLQSIGSVVVNKNVPLDFNNSVYVNATGKAYANLVGAQVTWEIDKPIVKS